MPGYYLLWRVIIYRLPAEASRRRTTTRRELRRLGAVPLQQGTWALPQREGSGAGLDAELAEGMLTLAELDEEEQRLDRLRRWYRAIRARDLFGAPSAPLGGRRLKECAEAPDRFAEQACRIREHGGPQ